MYICYIYNKQELPVLEGGPFGEYVHEGPGNRSQKSCTCIHVYMCVCVCICVCTYKKDIATALKSQL